MLCDIYILLLMTGTLRIIISSPHLHEEKFVGCYGLFMEKQYYLLVFPNEPLLFQP